MRCRRCFAARSVPPTLPGPATSTRANSFSIIMTVKVPVMCLLGGAGTVFGPVVGAAAFLMLEEFFWANFLEYNRAILGAVIVVLIFFSAWRSLENFLSRADLSPHGTPGRDPGPRHERVDPRARECQQAFRRYPRRQQRELRPSGWRDRRSDRSERCRQDHSRQCRHRAFIPLPPAAFASAAPM